MTAWTRRAAVVALGAGLGAMLCACSATESPVRPTPSITSRHSAGPGLPWPALPTAAMAPVRADRLQQELGRWVSTGLIPGVTAAVVSPLGTWNGAAGVDGRGVPLRPNTGMALASITKTFVAAEVMALAEQGRVDLDRAASSYLPVRWVSNGVTVRQLLEQRSGLHDVEWDPDLLTRPDVSWTPEQFLAPVATPTARPDQEWSYENANYLLAGMLVERVAGVDASTALQRDLWAPLGLTRLAYQDEQSLPAPLAAPGEDDFLPSKAAPGYVPFRSLASAAAGAGGMAGDAATVARWGYALYGALRLRPESVEQMTDFSDGDGYGLGTFDFSADYWQNFGLDGVGHVGEIPGFRSVLVVYPERQLSIAILTPSTVQAHPLVRQLITAGSLLAD